jgi:hypothetical protein
MTYEDFKRHFNTILFDNFKYSLFQKLATSPERYIGLFRSTSPLNKLLQNLTQSQEIRFGDAFEALITKYLAECGFENLPKNQQFNEDALNLDQYFKKDGKYYFVEQKMRDDHDSTKKRGQFENFTKKVNLLMSLHGAEIEAFMFFVDPAMTKNKRYYGDKALNLATTKGIAVHVCYGKEFFERLGIENIWIEIEAHLQEWHKGEFTNQYLNFDENVEDSFCQLKQLTPNEWLKLMSNDKIFNNFVSTRFPQKTTLSRILDYFLEKSQSIDIKTQERNKYQKVHELLKEKLEQ